MLVIGEQIREHKAVQAAQYLVLKQQFEILQESFGMALDKIAELERRPAKELKKIPELERKLAKALKKISELERKPVDEEDLGVGAQVAQHDNAHTPSKKAIGQKAKPQHGKPQQNGNGKSDTAKPRGGQKGHKGATYRPAPTRFCARQVSPVRHVRSYSDQNQQTQRHGDSASQKAVTTAMSWRHYATSAVCFPGFPHRRPGRGRRFQRGATMAW